ncbi:anti-phage dCTP deaminase [Acinetobacter junii]|uniref:anti-phage dCTP deaminase n=1 Tax=Acinetobacter junii TaxID=40215 RepID=UPI0014398C19|nr:anti-phage dCTP deaminase [Acinetobacter junii]NKG35919.1 deoxycytidylate deaminase [Acinetobacter junii]
MTSPSLISNLLSERSSFILIGLTGRTGSGCSTAAKLLTDPNLKFPEEIQVNYEKESYFSDLDKKRYGIVKNYASNNHHPFFLIKISDLITSKLFDLESENFIQLLEKIIDSHYYEKIKESKIEEKFIEIKNKISMEYPKIQKLICDSHELQLSEYECISNWQQIISQSTNELKQILKESLGNCYVKLYQFIGDSIRYTTVIDKDYHDKKFNPEGLHVIPQMVNKLIKVYRHQNSGSKNHIIIDAIRNPYEAKFFKDRYSAFYLISINAPSNDRKKYLQDKYKLNIEQISELDKKESGEIIKNGINDKDNIGKYHELITSNVKKCIEISDIHIFNPRNEPNNHNILKSQLAWYLSLIKHPGLITPTSLERVMQIAYTAKLNSGCISRQVGAVVTDEHYSIKAVGWNDVAKGQVPCNLRSLKEVTEFSSDTTYSEYERYNDKFQTAVKDKLLKLINIESGRNLSYCFKSIQNKIDGERNQVHTRSLHAEENAFLQLSKYGGMGIEGGKLFTTASPCELCAKKAYQLGIKEIIFIDPYPGIAIQHILHIGVNPPKLVQFRGAIGKSYQLLYEPLMPYKDELEFLV